MSRALIIEGALINDETDAYVIAEVGHNHQGDLEKAKAMFRAAKECGVNAVKLQKRDNRTLFTRKLFDQPRSDEASFGPTYGLHREALELGRAEYQELQRYAAQLGLTMFATAFDFPSADFLADLDMPAYKIASGDLLNTPLLKKVAAIGKPIVMSTGGGTLADVRRAYETIMPINSQLCILQATAAYPVEPKEMNLRVIETYRREFPEVVVGLSDHQNGIAMGPVAYVMGARVVEKHFTLNRAWKGTDHAFSLEPGGLRRLVRDLQRTREALGDGVKRPLPSEKAPLVKMGKKLVFARDLPSGHVLTREDIAIKSPNDGLPPFHLDGLVGRSLVGAVKEEDAITLENLE